MKPTFSLRPFLVAGFAAIIILTATRAWLFREEALPQYWEVPAFTLTAAEGQSFGRDAMKGKWWIADFMFTTCSDICPVMTKQMAALHEKLRDFKNLEFVSITVNPENDSPEALRAYRDRFAADPATWHFLTGPREAIETLMRDGFKLGSAEDPLFHSSRFVLVDPGFRIRGFYDGTLPEDVTRLEKQLRSIL